MATASGKAPNSEEHQDRRSRVVVGQLPEDFLRVDHADGGSAGSSPRHTQQEAADRALAMQLHQQQFAGSQGIAGQLIVTIVQANLVKNYGMTRMDPYVRLRVGHTVYETPTDSSGGKTPRWNKRIQCYLPTGVDTVHVEIFDECSLTMDELIAWTLIKVPEEVFKGETIDEWYPLSGKQGDNKEGSMNIIFSFKPVSAMPVATAPVAPSFASYPVCGASVVPVGPALPPVVYVPSYPGQGFTPIPLYAPGATPLATTVTNIPSVKPLTEQEMKEIEEMFPSIDKQVIQSVVDACGGRKEQIVDSLLQLSDQ